MRRWSHFAWSDMITFVMISFFWLVSCVPTESSLYHETVKSPYPPLSSSEKMLDAVKSWLEDNREKMTNLGGAGKEDLWAKKHKRHVEASGTCDTKQCGTAGDIQVLDTKLR